MGYTIICNSSTDLPIEVINEFNLKVVSLSFTIEDETYVNHLDHKDYDIKKFYEKLRGGTLATTTQVNAYEYEEVIKEELDKGKDVLILSFSSGLSGSFNSARIAVESFSDAKNKILLIDTKAASLGEGLLVYLAAMQKEAGKSIEEVYEYVNNLIPHLAHWFTVDDLMFLRRGGRLSSSSAIIGSVLRIKPILHVDDEGHLIAKEKTMGRRKSLQRLVKILEESIDTSLSKTVFISHGDDIDAANSVKDMVLALNLDLNVLVINYIGPVIGAHSGPGTIALFFTAKNR